MKKINFKQITNGEALLNKVENLSQTVRTALESALKAITMAGYSKPDEPSSIEETDTVDQAIGKLDASIDMKLGKNETAINAQKVNNLTVETAVPANAKFTDTTYSDATTEESGLMSAADKAKLNGISDSADAVSVTTDINAGTKVGSITINGTSYDLYHNAVPTSGGTITGNLTVNGTLTANVKGNADTATTAANSNKLGGLPLSPINKGNVFNTIPRIDPNGVTELGKYIDFHSTTADTKDYDVRLVAGENLLTSLSPITAPTFNGALNGNASTATEFSANKNIALTGAVVGSASSKAGWSINTTLKSCYAVVESEAVANTYFKIGSGSISGAYNSCNIIILVQNIMGSGGSGLWRITLNVGKTAGEFSAGTSTIAINTGLTASNFIVAYKSNSGGSLQFEIYCNIAARYAGYRFTILQEIARNNQVIGGIVTLSNGTTTNGQSAITSGFTALTTSNATVIENISGNASTATKINGKTIPVVSSFNSSTGVLALTSLS